MKVGVIGVGQVGAAATLALLARGDAREVVLVDQNSARAKGVALDMHYATPLLPSWTCGPDRQATSPAPTW